jgi:hypothetical protein
MRCLATRGVRPERQHGGQASAQRVGSLGGSGGRMGLAEFAYRVREKQGLPGTVAIWCGGELRLERSVALPLQVERAQPCLERESEAWEHGTTFQCLGSVPSRGLVRGRQHLHGARVRTSLPDALHTGSNICLARAGHVSWGVPGTAHFYSQIRCQIRY